MVKYLLFIRNILLEIHHLVRYINFANLSFFGSCSSHLDCLVVRKFNLHFTNFNYYTVVRDLLATLALHLHLLYYCLLDQLNFIIAKLH